MSLHGMTDITNMLSGNGILDTQIKSLLGSQKQLLHFSRNFTYTKSITRITIKTV